MENPDVVIVATGGRPNKGQFAGSDLAVSTWDILTGTVTPGENVLIYDDNGGHQAPSCAEYLATRKALVEFVTPGRVVGEEVGSTNIAVHLREFGQHGVISAVGFRLLEVNREANKLVAVLRNEYDLQEEERVIDQVVAQHGTLPRDELYFALKPLSRNLGQVDIQSLLQGRRQDLNDNIEGHFQGAGFVLGMRLPAEIYTQPFITLFASAKTCRRTSGSLSRYLPRDVGTATGRRLYMTEMLAGCVRESDTSHPYGRREASRYCSSRLRRKSRP